MLSAVRKLGQVLGLGEHGKMESTQPTIFHITHYKAGSQWVNRILHALAYDRLVMPEVENAQFLDKPLVAGAIYPTLYISREQFDLVNVPTPWHRFVVIRDLRDSLVSLYFSLKHSHSILTETGRERRAIVSDLSHEEGLLFVTENLLSGLAQIQWSWVAAGEELIKYEDLLERDEEILARVLLRDCKLNVDVNQFHDAVRLNRFEARSGRPPGQEDLQSHERKGIAGDWQNYFTGKIAKAFKDRFGSLLVATGYEKGFSW
jgi:lipopolysaccharide transport system ATP-binding protein